MHEVIAHTYISTYTKQCWWDRPGDATLPSLYAPMGTQVGTPAWIPESPEETADVAKIWFVIITTSGKKHVGSSAASVGPSADAHADTAASDADVDRRNGPVASCSGQPPVVLSPQGTRARAVSVHVAAHLMLQSPC